MSVYARNEFIHVTLSFSCNIDYTIHNLSTTLNTPLFHNRSYIAHIVGTWSRDLYATMVVLDCATTAAAVVAIAIAL